MWKVGPVRSVREATVFRNADILDVQLVGETGQPRAISETTYTELRKTSDALISVRADPLRLDPAQIARLSPDFLEFTPADPEKPGLLTEQLAALEPLGIPLICAGLTIARDDLSLLGCESHLERMIDAGARYVQVEIQSFVDPDFRIRGGVREQVVDLLARFPILISDSWTDLSAQTGIGETGLFFDLAQDGTTPAGVVRLMRGR